MHLVFFVCYYLRARLENEDLDEVLSELTGDAQAKVDRLEFEEKEEMSDDEKEEEPVIAFMPWVFTV